MSTVAYIRELNNRRPPLGPNLSRYLRCERCERNYTADLARYFAPRDAQEFWCPDCDAPLTLYLLRSLNAPPVLPLAQRVPRTDDD